ncbi:MAG: hypothetical protein HY335_05690 [Deinococcus sp.]|nr:hypothetical protein [Deinococcus sp.]
MRHLLRLLLLSLLLSSALAQRSEGILLRYAVPVGTVTTYHISQTVNIRLGGEGLAALGELLGGLGEVGEDSGMIPEEIPPFSFTFDLIMTEEVLSADDTGRVVRRTIDLTPAAGVLQLGETPEPVVLTVRIDPLGHTTLLEGDLSALSVGQDLPFDLEQFAGSPGAAFPVRPLAVGESFEVMLDQAVPALATSGITPQFSGVTTLRRLLNIGDRQVAKLVTDLTIAADIGLEQFLGPEGLGGLGPEGQMGESPGPEFPMPDLSGVQVRLEGAGQTSALYDLDGLPLNLVSAITLAVTLDIGQNTDPLVAFLALLFPSQDIVVTSRVEAIEVRRP